MPDFLRGDRPTKSGYYTSDDQLQKLCTQLSVLTSTLTGYAALNQRLVSDQLMKSARLVDLFIEADSATSVTVNKTVRGGYWLESLTLSFPSSATLITLQLGNKKFVIVPSANAPSIINLTNMFIYIGNADAVSATITGSAGTLALQVSGEAVGDSLVIP